MSKCPATPGICSRCTACKYMLAVRFQPLSVRFAETTDGAVHFVAFHPGSTLPARTWSEQRNLDLVMKF